MKTIGIFISLCLILNVCNVLETSASIRPIIINNTPNVINSDKTEVNLSWYIIDDNPKQYTILKNGSVLKNNINFESNVITLQFNDVVGHYNISLIVYDFSGYSASNNVIITITSASASTAPVTAATTTNNASISSKFSASSTGFSLLNIFFTLLVITTLIRFTKHKKKKEL